MSGNINKLNWNDHIKYISSSISKSTGILNKVNNILNTVTLVNLYYVYLSMLFTVIMYGEEPYQHTCPKFTYCRKEHYV